MNYLGLFIHTNKLSEVIPNNTIFYGGRSNYEYPEILYCDGRFLNPMTIYGAMRGGYHETFIWLALLEGPPKPPRRRSISFSSKKYFFKSARKGQVEWKRF
jgi:hypothetical protein